MNDKREYCRHRECQTYAENSLLWSYARLGRRDCLDAAIRLKNQPGEVICQRVPRPSNHGRPNAPLPPTKEV